jgi:hypothetical protein
MKTYLVNGHPIHLSDRDFLAEGGEGRVFVQGKWAYKVFHDPQKAVSRSKLLELVRLDRPEILGPRSLMEDENGNLAGFVMPFGKGEPLCKFFTETYRSQVGFSENDALKLAIRMQEVLAWIHGARCLVVDYNEHNLLVDAAETPLHIDVGAWQTPSYPATALMEHVRDPKVCGLNFTEGSDWFSFAVVLSQLYLGVHPYRGRHKDFKPVAWHQMMEKSISVFNRDVKLPPGTRDFSAIPRGHRDWLEAVLEHGERAAPPPPGAIGTIVAAPQPVPSSGKVRLDLVVCLPGRIREVRFYAGEPYVVTTVGIFRGRDQIVSGGSDRKFTLIPTHSGPPTWAEWHPQREELTLQLGSKAQIVPTSSFTVAHDRLWTVDGTYLRENKVVRFDDNLIFSTRPAAGAIPTARFGDGVLVQPMPGGDRFTFLLKTGGVQTFRLPELAGWRILAATGRDRLLQVLGRKGGDLQLVTVTLDHAGIPETTIIEPWTDYTLPSLAVTGKGIGVRLTDTELRLWRDIRQPAVLADPGLAADARLWVDGSDVYASEGSNLWRVRTV